MKTQIFAGIIEEHPEKPAWKKLKLNRGDWFQHQINKFKVGTKVTLYLDSKEPKRSEKQNALYWVYLTIIEAETGNSKEDLHALFKGKFLSNGITECFGEKVRKVKSTTKLTKGEFIEYLLDIENLTGIPVPDTENYGF